MDHNNCNVCHTASQPIVKSNFVPSVFLHQIDLYHQILKFPASGIIFAVPKSTVGICFTSWYKDIPIWLCNFPLRRRHLELGMNNHIFDYSNFEACSNIIRIIFAQIWNNQIIYSNLIIVPREWFSACLSKSLFDMGRFVSIGLIVMGLKGSALITFSIV